jgi:hypothetical protein
MIWLWALLACVGAEDDFDVGACEAPAATGESGRMIGFTESHNELRAEFGVPALVWDDGLAEAAAEWLEVLSTERDCQAEHNLDSPLGENLAWNKGFESHPCRVTAGWAEEEQDWDFETESCTGECGHWTQIMWTSTERIGCAVTACADAPDEELWMCTYDPPGNVPGQPPF